MKQRRDLTKLKHIRILNSAYNTPEMDRASLQPSIKRDLSYQNSSIVRTRMDESFTNTSFANSASSKKTKYVISSSVHDDNGDNDYQMNMGPFPAPSLMRKQMSQNQHLPPGLIGLDN